MKKIFKYFLMVVFLCSMLTACPSPDNTETEPALSPPVANISGSWNDTETMGQNTCGKTVGGVEYGTGTIAYTAGSNTFTLTDDKGNHYNGNISGADISYSGPKINSDCPNGHTIKFSGELQAPDYTTFLGSSTWTCNYAGGSCSGTTAVSAICTNCKQDDCTYAISPDAETYAASGGSDSVSVTAKADCNWLAASNVSWVHITAGSSGSGNGTVGYSVDANSSAGQRTGTMTIAGKTFTITQNAPTITVKVLKYRGSVQCTGGGTAPEIMQNELIDAGIEVISYSCGSDGRIYPAVCGASDGRINIFEISESMTNEAQALGFYKLDTLPNAKETECPVGICTPSETLCVAGDTEKIKTCNGTGTAWITSSCPNWTACANKSCHTICGITSSPAHPTVCLYPIADGVNNGEWYTWYDSSLTGHVTGRSRTGSNGYAPIYSSGQTWPYMWSIGSSDMIGFQFTLNQYSGVKYPRLTYRGKRSGILNYSTYYTVGIFNAVPTMLGSCTGQSASLSWGTQNCFVGPTQASQLNYSGGWNAMWLSVTGDGWGNPPDLLDLNYIYLDIE